MHFIGDFFLRNQLMNKYKSKISMLSLHCFFWSCSISVVLEYFNLFTLEKFFFLLIGHFIIDYCKGKVDPHPDWVKDDKPDVSVFKITDQLFHIGQLLIVWRIM